MWEIQYSKRGENEKWIKKGLPHLIAERCLERCGEGGQGSYCTVVPNKEVH